ncbi:MAG: class I SAM-dependent methyltransferase [Sedimentisphaerales bacterium]|jgi:2-polyprenyl-3-methyl-5-hydroxy-6-metoxy-1,4-benzoquinol methylase|nr:class I SAM-dependent methyltransferase [Sedimentisphaerales bacterium]HOH63411.1 class I SAM-dependent methyltransferase [Sedimentisphaerales bacterium]
MHTAQPNEADYLLYTKSAGQYDRVRFAGMAGQWGHRRQVEILANLNEDWRDKKVLEIGCGTGRITEILARWGTNVTATDISSEMLSIAQSRFKGREPSPRSSFRVMSVSDIDIDLGPFDYIIMVNVFGRLSNPSEVIDAIASRMAPPTRLVFTFPCLTSVLLPFGILANARGRSLSRDVTSRWYTPKTIAKMCHRANLEIVQFRGNHYVPVPRLLFWTLPFFWVCDKLLAAHFPTRCPSVFVECRLSPTAA